jgi:predicted ester cyclase
MIGMYMTAFPDMKGKMTQSFGDREFVVAEFEYTGTQKGPLGPIKPTGKSVDMHQLEIDQFKDGKIVKGWAWGNNMEMLTQLGVVPGPGDAPAPAPSGAPSAAPSAKPAK